MDFDSPFDRTTWQALTVVLTVLGLVATVLLWRSRGAIGGLRMFAVTLLPAAAYLTGAIRMLWEIGDAVVSFAVRLTFSPTVWVGVALAGLAVVLWVVAGYLRGRGGTSSASTARPKRAPAAKERSAVETGRPGTGAKASPAAEGARGSDDGPGDGLDDGIDDIEAILRRHGIE